MLLKCRKGFVFLDLLLTLTCILLFTSFLLPSVNSLFNIQQNHSMYLKADELYNNIIKQQSIETKESVENPIKYKNTHFIVQFDVINHDVLLCCIRWLDDQGIEESLCRYVPT